MQQHGCVWPCECVTANTPGFFMLHTVSLHLKAQGRHALEGERMHMAVCTFASKEETWSVQQRVAVLCWPKIGPEEKQKHTLCMRVCIIWQRCRCRGLCVSDSTKTAWDWIYVFRVCCHTADDGGRGVVLSGGGESDRTVLILVLVPVLAAGRCWWMADSVQPFSISAGAWKVLIIGVRCGGGRHRRGCTCVCCDGLMFMGVRVDWITTAPRRCWSCETVTLKDVCECKTPVAVCVTQLSCFHWCRCAYCKYLGGNRI